MKTHCLECDTPVVGRSDKKFCNDACRNAFNNRYNKDCNNLMRNTHNTLRRNWRILNQLNPDCKTNTTKSELLLRGFDFRCITGIALTAAAEPRFFVYDQSYLPLENDYFAIEKCNHQYDH